MHCRWIRGSVQARGSHRLSGTRLRRDRDFRLALHSFVRSAGSRSLSLGGLAIDLRQVANDARERVSRLVLAHPVLLKCNVGLVSFDRRHLGSVALLGKAAEAVGARIGDLGGVRVGVLGHDHVAHHGHIVVQFEHGHLEHTKVGTELGYLLRI